jgi:hypothetical protein
MQDAIHFCGARAPAGVWRIGPESSKGFGIFPPTFEAGTVACGKRGDLVQKEKLGVELPPDVAVTSIEFQAAADPGAADVPPFAQGPIVVMKSSAAVSQHRSPRVYSVQLSISVNPILEHLIESVPTGAAASRI